MDDLGGFGNIGRKCLEAELRLAREADLVLASSNPLLERLQELNPSTMLLRNATDFRHFHQAIPNGKLDRLSDRPMVGYYGAIAEWFDTSLVAHCASNRPDWNFVLIGATLGCDISSLVSLKNVHILGEISYDDLPGYYAYFNACIIPFRLIPLILATNPVKFYEYLSAGKPVVSTVLPELKPFRELCYLADGPDAFLDGLDRAVAENRDNSAQIRRKRMETARTNSWDSRVDLLMQREVFRIND
jgi:glycosyltransferase involved in cell wall biosynthesis